MVTVAIGNNLSSGTLSGDTTIQAVNGAASFADLSIDRGSFGYTLRATTPWVGIPATSAPFGIEGFSDRASMNEPRQYHTATFLYTDKILIAGGGGSEGASLDSAELYDPEDDTFIGLPNMSDFRGGHTATTLLDGKVLIVGGSLTASADIFDPATGTFTEAAGMTYARTNHRASLLQDGRVLVTGGSPDFGDPAEIYDPATGLWSLTGTMHESRASHASTWLPNGMVLITGGGVYVTSAELFDPSSGTFTSVGDMAGGARYAHTATLLNNGTVLITGGTKNTGDLSTAEIFDPAAGTFKVTGTMHGAHSGHQAVLLRDGKVLIVGDGEPEIYDPSTGEFRLTGPAYIAGSQGNAAIAIKDGRVLVTGGYGEGVMPYTEMWNPLFPFPTRVISGHVRHLGVGLPGVLMAGFPGFPITDSGGYYEAVVMDGWSGTVVPTKPGYTFGPASTVYSPIGGDLTAQDYNVLTVPTFTIYGVVRANALPLEGVVMNGLPGNPSTNASGVYSATVNLGWSGTATPLLAGYAFTPASITYASVQANQTGDYTATGSYALTLSKAGLGAGTVTSVPPGIDCGADCSETFISGTPVTLTAAGVPGSAFAGWSGDVPTGHETDNPLIITMNGNRNITASFSPPPALVIATSSVPDGVKGTPYNTSLSASGGFGDVTWSVVGGSLPPGLALETTEGGTGLLIGTPTAAGHVSFIIQATDGASQTATQALSLTVADWVAAYDGPAHAIDIGLAIAVDASGNVYVTGEISGTGTGYDYATIKYDPSGNQVWARTYNGPGSVSDTAEAIAVDAMGNVYVTGESGDASGSFFDYATIKYDSNGNQLWVARYNSPGNANDIARAIAVDASGNVYVTGESEGGSPTYRDFATVKYDRNGNQLWVARFSAPGISYDSGYSVAVSPSGNVYVTGYSTTDSGIDYDYATVKYDGNGNQLWVATYEGTGSGEDSAVALALDASENVYITGSSMGSGTGKDYATIKYDGGGHELWVARYTGPGNYDDDALGIAVDHLGRVSVTGGSTGSDTSVDYATVMYDVNGNQLWASRYPSAGPGIDRSYAIAVDPLGYIYVTGMSAGRPVTIKYDDAGSTQWVARYVIPSVGAGEGRAVTLGASGNIYIAGGSAGSGTGEDYATIAYTQSFPSTLIITTESLDRGLAGVPYAKDLWAFGGSATRAWSVISGNLPPGLTLDPASGLISGTPTALGVYSLSVQVRDGDLVASKPLSLSIEAASGVPYELAFGQQPHNAMVNATLIPPVTVEIRDGAGNLVPNATNTVTLSLTTYPPGAILSGTLSKAAVAGVATFDDLKLDQAFAGYTIFATAEGLAWATSNIFDILVAGSDQIGAPLIATGTYQDLFGPSGYEHWFKVVATEDQDLRISTGNAACPSAPDDVDLDVFVYDGAGRLRVCAYSNRSEEVVYLSNVHADTYYVKIWSGTRTRRTL